MQKEMKEKEGWDQLFSKGGSVTKIIKHRRKYEVIERCLGTLERVE
jgi:hypothetical protein